MTNTSDRCCEDTTHIRRGGLLWGMFRGIPFLILKLVGNPHKSHDL